MEAYILEKNGGLENLKKTVDMIDLIPKENEVLIETKAIGINPIDAQVRNSKDMLTMISAGSVPPAVILGWDVAGVVKQVGESVTKFAPGDHVYGLINMPGLGQTYATQVIAPEEHLSHKPKSISFEMAAATPMAAMTAWQSVMTLGKIKKGETVLIHGAAGGVGHFAVQFAKHIGAYVIATASARDEEFVKSLGVDVFIDYTKVDFETELDRVDAVIDTVNSISHVQQSINVIKPNGRLVYLQPHFSEAIRPHLEAAHVAGYGVFVNSSGEILDQISSLMQESNIRPKVTRTFAFDELPTAHQLVEGGGAAGKVVVIID